MCSDDSIVSPTYLPDLVNACLDLLIDEESGLWHLANDGAVSWLDFARRVAESSGIQNAIIVRRSDPLPAVRPDYTVLGSRRALLLPKLDKSLAQYFADRNEFLETTPTTRRHALAGHWNAASDAEDSRSYEQCIDPQAAS